MQTALAKDSSSSDETTERIRLVLDCGSQQSYISQYFVKKWKLKEIGASHLSVYTTCVKKSKNLETPIVEIGIMLKCGLSQNYKQMLFLKSLERLKDDQLNPRMSKLNL